MSGVPKAFLIEKYYQEFVAQQPAESRRLLTDGGKHEEFARGVMAHAIYGLLLDFFGQPTQEAAVGLMESLARESHDYLTAVLGLPPPKDPSRN